MKTGSVTLVGAGCGSLEWLTLEGLHALQACSAVVYDDLIDPMILAQAPADAVKVPVGKRCGRESARQEDINAQLCVLASAGHRVVRLKGGDPFMFGRGGEEILALNASGIPWHIVPGITSAIAIPMEAGIPVTHRAVSRGVHIVTGHTKDSIGPEAMEQLAQSHDTLVFLMGLNALECIAAGLTRFGKPATTPAAVVSGGNSPVPVRVIGTLGDIVEKAAAAGASSPAVIVVGDVCALNLIGGAVRPLNGVRIGLTGTDEFRARQRDALAFTGAHCIDMMTAQLSPTFEQIPWDSIASGAGNYLVYTSVNGVDHFFARALAENFDLRRLAGCKFAAIGNATAEALRKHGFIADLISPVATSEGLSDALIDVCRNSRVFSIVSAKGSDVIENKLKAHGIDFTRVNIYDTDYQCLSQDLKVDRIVFGSAGGVHALRDSGYVIAPDTKCVCIGPVCAQALLNDYGIEPIIAGSISVEGVADALVKLG